MNWQKRLKGKIRRGENLKAHTTFKIGGPARLFIEPRDIEDLKSLLNLLKSYKISSLVIGSGSNILAGDKGINSAVIRLSSPYFQKLVFKNNYLEAGSGVVLSRIVRESASRSLSGAEFLAGIPGTLGGALIMNAGAWGKESADFLQDVTVMDKSGNVKTLKKEDIKFGYRSSGLSRYIILSARIRLIESNKLKIEKRIKKYLDYRYATQDLTLPSAGCAFKNPAGDSAGRLIELCGLKGAVIGGAQVSLKHANFILNSANAKASDVFKLMGLIRKEVKKRFKINLEPEIKIWNWKS